MNIKNAEDLVAGDIISYNMGNQMATVTAVTTIDVPTDQTKVEVLTMDGREAFWRTSPSSAYRIIDPADIRQVDYLRVWLNGYSVMIVGDDVNAAWGDMILGSPDSTKPVTMIDKNGVESLGGIVLGKITSYVHGTLTYESLS